jgi:hypothetical protein
MKFRYLMKGTRQMLQALKALLTVFASAAVFTLAMLSTPVVHAQEGGPVYASDGTARDSERIPEEEKSCF